MQRDVLKKLRIALNQPITDECQVIYILVEIRKILEHQAEHKLKNSYSLLKFYCDWVLHIKIDRSNPAKKIIQELDKAVDDLNKKHEDDDTFVARISGIISFKNFRGELDNLLLKLKLPNEITEKGDAWENFIEIFSHVITDCPLMTKENLLHVEQFSITKKHRKNSFSWQIVLKENDGVPITLIGAL